MSQIKRRPVKPKTDSDTSAPVRYGRVKLPDYQSADGPQGRVIYKRPETGSDSPPRRSAVRGTGGKPDKEGFSQKQGRSGSSYKNPRPSDRRSPREREDYSPKSSARRSGDDNYPRKRASAGRSGDDYPKRRTSAGQSGDDYPRRKTSAGNSGDDYPRRRTSAGNSGDDYPGRRTSAGNSGDDYPGKNSGTQYPRAKNNYPKTGSAAGRRSDRSYAESGTSTRSSAGSDRKPSFERNGGSPKGRLPRTQGSFRGMGTSKPRTSAKKPLTLKSQHRSAIEAAVVRELPMAIKRLDEIEAISDKTANDLLKISEEVSVFITSLKGAVRLAEFCQDAANNTEAGFDQDAPVLETMTIPPAIIRALTETLPLFGESADLMVNLAGFHDLVGQRLIRIYDCLSSLAQALGGILGLEVDLTAPVVEEQADGQSRTKKTWKTTDSKTVRSSRKKTEGQSEPAKGLKAMSKNRDKSLAGPGGEDELTQKEVDDLVKNLFK